MAENGLIKAKIKAIYLHPTQKVPVVFITDEAEQVVIPMVVGFLEAQAILTAWQGIQMPRPVTIDLLKHIIEDDFGADLKQVVLSEVRGGAFLAVLHIRRNGQAIERDSRPSDALALALRARAPIYLGAKLIERLKSEQGNARAMLDYLEAEGEDSGEILKF